MMIPTETDCSCYFSHVSAKIGLVLLVILFGIVQVFRDDPILLILLIIAVCLLWLYGIKTKRAVYIVPMLILGGIFVFIVCLLPLYNIFILIILPDSELANEIRDHKIASTVIYIIMIPVSIYLFIKNYSVYQHMKEIAAEVERTGQNVSQGVTFEQEGAIRQEV